MSGWGTNGNANRIKDTYIKGFLDISGGPLIVEKTSSLQIMAHDGDYPILEFKPEFFTVNTGGAFDVSYSALASLSVLGLSFEQSTAAVLQRIKYITSGTIGVEPNEVFFTEIGNDDEQSQLQVYGLIKGHYGLEVDGDVSFNNKFFVVGDSSFNSDVSIGGNLYVAKRSVFGLDVDMNGNLSVGSGNNFFSLNKDISPGYVLDVSGKTILRNGLEVVSDASFGTRLFVVGDSSLNGNLYVGKRSIFTGDVSMNGNIRLGQSVSLNKDISSGYTFDVSGLTILRNGLQVVSDASFGARLFVVGDSSLNGNLYVDKRSIFTGDVSMNGNIRLGTGLQSVSLNKDISSGYTLDVSGLTILRNGLQVVSDASFGTRLFVVGDSSLNGNLYVDKRSIFTGDVSMNGNIRLGTGLQTVSLNKDISSGYTLDVSGLTILRNGLQVVSDASFGTRLFVVGDSSLNGNLYVDKRSIFTGDVSMNGNIRLGTGLQTVSLNKDISSGYTFDVSGFTIFRNRFEVLSDVSMNGNIRLGTGLQSVSVNKDISSGYALDVSGFTIFRNRFEVVSDVSMNGNIRLGTGVQSVSLNKDISSGYILDVSGFTILRNRLEVLSDVSMNGNIRLGTDVQSVSINKDISSNYALDVSGFTILRNRLEVLSDVSMNGNIRLGTGLQSVSINKDISSNYALDVSGYTVFRNNVAILKDISSDFVFDVSGKSQFRGNVDVSGVFTVNGEPVSAGGALTGNVQVGTNNGFVSIDKPQFYADPSLTIYYNFDASINAGTGIKNIATATTLYDASFNRIGSNTTNGMIDTTNKIYGTASLKNTSNAGALTNTGIYVINPVPVDSIMSFSLWIKKSELPTSTTFDRIFEFTNTPGVNIDNNVIGLDINASGIIMPVLTNGSGVSCLNTLTSPIIQYNICDNNWHNIIWIINPSQSSIYIDGAIQHYDTLNANPVPLETRTNAYIAYSSRTNINYDFSGNIDDFRYYRSKALSYAEVYQLNNNKFYTLDICGGFLANGPSVIYEASGSTAGANRGTLTLMHGDASGSSSIMFKSVNDPQDYAYIEYDENATGSTGTNYGLMVIGIENEAGSTTTQADRISLFASGGTGFVGVNTKTPVSALDVSGTLNTNADASMNGVSVGRGGGNLASNTILGYQALKTNTTGANNVALGYQALTQNTSNNNTAVGYQALQINTNNNNTAVGYQSLFSNTNGNSNIAVGSYALNNNNVGINNTAIGYDAGNNTSTSSVGSQNTYLGASTTMNGSYTNSTALGNGAIITASNIVQLGNASCTAQSTSFNATSDYREKDNVMDLNETFTVDVLRPVVYDFKPLGKKHIGFIAHEVQEFYPYLVNGEKDGLASQTMNYNGFIGILTKEIQVLKKKVAEQETRISEQAAKAADQETRIQALEKMVLDLVNK
jgi:hypothetical protein